ncbi:MAG: hypothetical protein R3B06_00995 [Kofleriaceae bacterium]
MPLAYVDEPFVLDLLAVGGELGAAGAVVRGWGAHVDGLALGPTRVAAAVGIASGRTRDVGGAVARAVTVPRAAVSLAVGGGAAAAVVRATHAGHARSVTS